MCPKNVSLFRFFLYKRLYIDKYKKWAEYRWNNWLSMSKRNCFKFGILLLAFIVKQQRRSHLPKKKAFNFSSFFIFISERASAESSINLYDNFISYDRKKSKQKILFREIINKNVDLLLRFQQKSFCIFYHLAFCVEPQRVAKNIKEIFFWKIKVAIFYSWFKFWWIFSRLPACQI